MKIYVFAWLTSKLRVFNKGKLIDYKDLINTSNELEKVLFKVFNIYY